MQYLVPSIAAFMVLLLFVATITIRGRKRREQSTHDAPELEYASATASTPPSEALSKAERGECRFCGRRAEYRTPIIRHARPWGDAMLRQIGVVPQVKFQLAIPKDLGAEVDLCDLHHHRAVSLLGAEIAAASADMAKFCDTQVRHLIEFQATGLEAKIAADASERRKRKPLASVTAMVPQKSNGNGAHA